MPNRIIKESICASDQINALSPFEEVLFYRLMVKADDYGRYDGRLAIIKNTLFPLKDSLRVEQIEKALHTLSSQELVARYEVDGRPFVRLTGWDRHQTIRAKKSKYPAPEEGCMQVDANACEKTNSQTSASKCMQVDANVHVIQSYSESESESYSVKGAKAPTARARTRFTPPTPDEVNAYCREHGYQVDGQRFCDFYASKGWVVGKTPMKDWHAAVRGWASRDTQAGSSGQAPPVQRGPKVVREQQYKQREYEDDEGVPDWMLAQLKELNTE